MYIHTFIHTYIHTFIHTYIYRGDEGFGHCPESTGGGVFDGSGLGTWTLMVHEKGSRTQGGFSGG